MKIEVTQCSMCKHYSEEQYCEIWQQYIANDTFYCACGARADRKTENSSEFPNNCKDLQDWKDQMWTEAMRSCGFNVDGYRQGQPKVEPQTIAEDINRRVETGKKEWNARHIEDEPQTEYDKYREKIRPHDPHKDWFKDEPQTERHLPDYSYEADLGRRIMEQTERSK